MADNSNIIDNITGNLKDNVEYAKEALNRSWESTLSTMSNDASKLLNRMREGAFGGSDSAFDDMFLELRQLGSNAVSPITNAYSNLYNRLESIVDKNIALAKEHLSGVAQDGLNSIGSSLGIGNIGDSLIKVNSYSPPIVSRVSSLWKEAYKGAPESQWDYIDPVSSSVNLPIYIKAALEESGYIADKYRANQYARDLHFITRPTLESDNGGHYRSYAFFTRPNLNLVDYDGSSIQLVQEMANYPSFATLCMSDLGLTAELCRDGASKSNLFTLLNNYVKEVPPIRLAESNREGIKNMYGKSTPIPGIPEVYGEVDISVTFVDNARGDIAKLLYILSTYKSVVGREGFPMRPEYIKYRGIDYLMSLYIVTVDANWEIVGFGVAIGLMISEPPTHFTQHKLDGFSKNDLLEEFTVTFKAATYFPMAPDYYDDFNRISGFDPSNIVDTKGSGHNLFVGSRSVSTRDSSHSLRGSVWSSTGGFDGAGNTIMNTTTGTVQRSSLNVVQTVIGNIFKSDSEQTMDQEVITDDAVKQYKGVFELAGRCPGIYTSTNSKEPHRRRFMLGFSF